MTRQIVSTSNKKLMDNQDTVKRGDSKAVITERISFSLDKETADALTEEASRRHMSRSELLRDLIIKGLKLSY